MKENNNGISLISLILTIIVMIILAAIVIFTGIGTANNANFAKFTSEFSDFNLAVNNAYMEEVTDNALNNQTRSKAQIYYKLASGIDVGMNGVTVPAGSISELGIVTPEALEGNKYYLVTDDKNIDGWSKHKQYFEPTEKHYITDEGEAFVLPGYLVEEDGVQKWWINERKYYIGEKKVPKQSNVKLSVQYDDKTNVVSWSLDGDKGEIVLKYINYYFNTNFFSTEELCTDARENGTLPVDVTNDEFINELFEYVVRIKVIYNDREPFDIPATSDSEIFRPGDKIKFSFCDLSEEITVSFMDGYIEVLDYAWNSRMKIWLWDGNNYSEFCNDTDVTVKYENGETVTERCYFNGQYSRPMIPWSEGMPSGMQVPVEITAVCYGKSISWSGLVKIGNPE